MFARRFRLPGLTSGFIVLLLAAFTVGCSGGDTGGATVADCPSSQTLCDDACYDLSSSPQACGTCDNACEGGQVCSDGVCETRCAEGLIDCGGACVDPMTDRGFCGAADTCEGAAAGEICTDEQVCSGGTCQTNCTGGTLLCDGRCADPKFDPSYCGATADCAGENAGAVCEDDEVCDGGECRSECGPDNIVCGGGCVDPSANPNFCGATADCAGANAGTVCGQGESCFEGECQPNCPVGQLACNGQCVDPMTNPNFCGASGTCTEDDAGVACGGDESCLGGTCFSAGVAFTSPFNRLGVSVTPRAVLYSFDTTIPDVTVHYTVDGTTPVPSMGSTTTTTDPFQVGPLRDGEQVRWLVEVDGRLSEPNRLEAELAPTNERGAIVESLQIDGQGPVATVAPGASFNVTGNIQYWRQNANGFCPGCVVQANVSLQGVGRVQCYEATSSYPGRNGSFNRTLTAPSEPGDYVMAVTNPLDFGCDRVSTGYIGGSPVGLLQVRPPVRTTGGN